MRTPGMGGHWPSLDTIATGQTAVVAVLLVTQFVPQPHVSSGVADLGGLAYGVPLASFVVMAVSLAAGFGMLLTGASRSGARLRGTAAPPRTERAQLAAPAPACGSASGSWALMTPVTTQIRCGHGLGILTVSPGSLGELGLAPDAAFPAAYRVAVRVNLVGLPRGCAVLGVAMHAESGYLNEVCAGGIWAIDGPGDKVLGHGGLPGKAKPHGASTEIEAALSGGVDYLIVNGVPVAEVPAPATSGTAYVLLAALNRGTSSGSASFSDFSLRPGKAARPGNIRAGLFMPSFFYGTR